MIENASKGENWLFRNFYVDKDGNKLDALDNGRLSCAVLLSSILYLQNSSLEFNNKPKWIKFVHANVPSTVKDMEENGWYEIDKLIPGAVIVWEKRDASGSENWHMGFFIGDEMAVSNDSGRGNSGFSRKHHYTYNDTRKIEKIYWHQALDQE